MSGLNVDLPSALQEAVERYVAANPRSLRQHEKATASLPGGNSRTILFAKPFPVALVGGQGAYLQSLDGARYVDFLGEYTAGLFGHSEPVIMAAIQEALAGGIALGGLTVTEQRFAALLCARFPSLERLRFTNSGTEANLLAVSTARVVTGREKILVFTGSYHGSVFMFAEGGGPMNAPFPFLQASYNDIEKSLAVVRENAGSLAAILVEPMLGAGGCIPAEREFLVALRQAASDVGALLIFDEVMTSRLGPGGLQQELGIRPDMTTLGKYLGGGLTIGAFGGRAEIMDRFDPRRAQYLVHSGTFNNNILSMTAGYAAMSQVFTPEAASRLNQEGEELRARLNGLAAAAGLPMQFTGRGSMMTVHFSASPISAPADAARGDARLRELFYFDLLEAGIWPARRGMLNLSLPMTAVEHGILEQAIANFIESRRGLFDDQEAGSSDG